MEMKTILCYGDSNTWGYDPATKTRYDRQTRWTRILARSLGKGYDIIEEGLNARTTVHEDPLEPGRNGLTYLGPCLITHKPIDLVIILLGTNDLKKRLALSPYDIGKGIRRLLLEINHGGCGPAGKSPKVLLLVPPPLAKLSEYAQTFEEGTEKSKMLATEYAKYAEEFGCEIIDTGQHIVTSDVDGVHWEADQHRLLGELLAVKVREMWS